VPRTFIDVRIGASGELAEHLGGLLSQLGFEGLWEEEAVLHCYMDAGRWSPALEEEVRRIIALAATGKTPLPPVELVQVADRNWNEEWERTITPIRVTDRMIITPSWQRPEPRPGDLVLTIDPKMSFGTGYHESTRLVLRLLERHLKPRSRVLDVGTGTGVLAIAAVKLGAAGATGVDIDEWSLDNATENVMVNGVADRVRILRGDLAALPLEAAELIVANIQRAVLLDLLPELLRRLAPGGMLILSGLLHTDREAMLTALTRSGLHLLDELNEGEWIALVATR
jgi:ribosomal protein L11 methyltransferase